METDQAASESVRQRSLLMKWVLNILIALMIIITGVGLILLSINVRPAAISFLTRTIDPLVGCDHIRGSIWTSRAYSGKIEVKDQVNGEILTFSADDPYPMELLKFCDGVEKAIGYLWILIPALIAWILYQTKIWGFLKAASMAVPLFWIPALTTWEFNIKIILSIGLLVYFIAAKKQWVYPFAVIVFSVISFAFMFIMAIS